MYCIVTVVRFVIILIKFYVCMYVCVKMWMGRCRVELGVGTGVKMLIGRVFSVGSKWCGTSVEF